MGILNLNYVSARKSSKVITTESLVKPLHEGGIQRLDVVILATVDSFGSRSPLRSQVQVKGNSLEEERIPNHDQRHPIIDKMQMCEFRGVLSPEVDR